VAEVSVTPATAAALDVAVQLLRAQLSEHDIFPSEEALREVTCKVLSDPRHGFILLAAAGGEPVGIAYAAAHLSAEHGGSVGWLEELYVSPEWRGRGVGAVLLEEVHARAAELQWKALELEVVAGHERAVPLYLRHGFLPVSRARYTRLLSQPGHR
jgi:GNAT superfamily N-acetyltransferase